MPDPVVDVLIPAFNAERTLADSIGSIQRQSLADIRIVVVDDGSTDATGVLLSELAREDPRIEVVSQPNGGIVEALNTGLAHCRAPLVARHDADDLAFTERLAAQVAYMAEMPDCVAVSANAWHVDGDGRRLGTVSDYGGPTHADPHRLPAREPYLMHPFLMVRREALVAAGGYRYVFHAEDTDLYWRLLSAGRLFGLEAPLGEYRCHPGSISSASVVNGRMQAVMSQLAALSFLRRERGQVDLDFPKADKTAYEKAGALEAMLALATRALSPEEAAWLRPAAALKLLEQGLYRPYRLDADDHRLARTALREAASSSDVEQSWRARQLQAESGAQLLAQGRWLAAMRWTPAFLGPRPLLDLWRVARRVDTPSTAAAST